MLFFGCMCVHVISLCCVNCDHLLLLLRTEYAVREQQVLLRVHVCVCDHASCVNCDHLLLVLRTEYAVREQQVLLRVHTCVCVIMLVV